MALRLLCHPSSSWTADGRRLLRMDSESMAAFVVDVVETLSQMLHTSAHCWRALKITKEQELPAIEKRGVLDDPRFAHAARNLPDFASPNRCPAILLHFAARRSTVRYTSHAATRLLNSGSLLGLIAHGISPIFGKRSVKNIQATSLATSEP